MSRSRRARVPITATLISLAMASTTLFGTPAQAAAQVPPRDAKAAAPVSQVAPKAPKAAADPFSVLVFSKTAGFRHDSIPAGIAAIQQLGADNGFTVDATEDAAAFTDANLAQYAAVVWLSTTGDVLDADPAGRVRALHPGRRRLRGRPRRVRHRVRLALVRRPGRRVLRRPPGQPAGHDQGRGPGAPVHGRRCRRSGRGSTSGTTSRPTRAATCTCWPASTRRSYAPGAGAMGADHPIAWCHDYDGGRSWYTGGGHTIESYAEPQFLAHLLGGIQTAAGAVDARLRRDR